MQQHVFIACWQRGTTPARARSGLGPLYYRIASMDQFRLHFGLPLPHTINRDKSWDWCHAHQGTSVVLGAFLNKKQHFEVFANRRSTFKLRGRVTDQSKRSSHTSSHQNAFHGRNHVRSVLVCCRLCTTSGTAGFIKSIRVS